MHPCRTVNPVEIEAETEHMAGTPAALPHLDMLASSRLALPVEDSIQEGPDARNEWSGSTTRKPNARRRRRRGRRGTADQPQPAGRIGGAGRDGRGRKLVR